MGKPIVQKDTKSQALLVIDVQESLTGSLSTDDYYIRQSEELIKNINEIADSSAKHNVPVIYIKSEISNSLINILNSSLAKGSPGATFDSRLKIVSDLIISKSKNDAFSNSLLDSILVRNDINKLIFTGLDLSQCVNSTILAAINRKYEICLISDAVLANSDSLHEVRLNEFKERGFEILSSKEYFNITIQ